MKPKVFIGSSREGVPIANAIHANLTREAECTVWTQGVFNLSQGTLVDLIRVLRDSDFGVFVFSPDDISLMRDNVNPVVRDNVIFELGLFIGRLGTERSFFLVPDDVRDLRLPTDLAGITPGMYEGHRSDGNWMAATGPACMQIAFQMSRLKPFQDINVVGDEADASTPTDNGSRDIGSTSSPRPRAKRGTAATKSVAKRPEDGAGVTAEKYGKAYLLQGDTKPCKEVLKGLGASWNQKLGGWIIPPSKMPQLMHELPKVVLKND